MSPSFASTTPSFGLLTDLYQLTMAAAGWKSGRHQREAVFTLFFREAPFRSGFTVACGLATALEFIKHFRFEPDDLSYLAGLSGQDDQPLFERGFLDYLSGLRFTGDVDAIPEGTIVFPQEPLLRVSGPILQGQLLESALLNIINFQTLVATKAARICLSARGDPVIEFGLRRAQGVDGALTATRAAYVGGCAGTSNVLAGRLHGIPVRGTHAHSWVMSFEHELEAFQAYAKALPNNCIFLVDTYDTLQGVRYAIEVGHWLRTQGHELGGIRLDSGDLACLSIEARKLLDAAGFPKAVIVASNDLDEHLVNSLKEQGAAIRVWGIGTRLVTAYDQPALGGVYKLTALRKSTAEGWDYRIKLSEQPIKVNIPGIQQVRRFVRDGEFVADGIYDCLHAPPADFTLVDLQDPTHQVRMPKDAPFEDLLVPVFRRGQQVYAVPALSEARARTQAQLQRLTPGARRLSNPQRYLTGLESSLHELKTRLIFQARKAKPA